MCPSHTGCIKLYVVDIFKRGESKNKKTMEMLGGQKAMSIYPM